MKWQVAIECLIMAAEGRGPSMHARIGVMQALNRNVERVFKTGEKQRNWGKRKLARDRWLHFRSGDLPCAYRRRRNWISSRIRRKVTFLVGM